MPEVADDVSVRQWDGPVEKGEDNRPDHTVSGWLEGSLRRTQRIASGWCSPTLLARAFIWPRRSTHCGSGILVQSLPRPKINLRQASYLSLLTWNLRLGVDPTVALGYE